MTAQGSLVVGCIFLIVLIVKVMSEYLSLDLISNYDKTTNWILLIVSLLFISMGIP